MQSLTKYQFIILLLAGFPATAQLYFQRAENGSSTIPVYNPSKQEYIYAWAGGMNSCQFGELDLDMDGIKDLVAFDRVGDRILPFLNGGQPGQVDYTFAPEYAGLFPPLVDWAVFRDYNSDGREDIFTYSGDYPGIVVYQNTSQDQLSFELAVYPYLTSFQGGGQVNILTTDVDYPGIEDIDNDGDLDILTFWGLGSFVEYHQNQSKELYGVPDSLEYVEITQCWGRFAENDESNVIYLDTCLDKSQYTMEGVSPSIRSRHTGSTFLLFDFDGDQDKDLLLGDVDYPDLIALTNGGDLSEAQMISQDPDFPSYDLPIELFSMPVAAFMDVDNDGNCDLLVSPFDPSLVSSENYHSAWFYRNVGSNEIPDFRFVQSDFLQQKMIDVGSGSCPVFADYNSDGLQDLFVSNFGYYIYSYYDPYMFLYSVYYSAIALFLNSGTATEPAFSQLTHNFADLQKLMITGLYPSFGDLDADGDLDMLSGRDNGTLMFLENLAGGGQSMEFGPPHQNYQGIDVGDYSTPQLIDLDKDGRIDLVIGERNGNLNYYRNSGSVASPQFTLVTDSLGQVNVTDYNQSYTGYSVPCFFRNLQGQIELAVGSEKGDIFYYRNIEGNLDGIFDPNDSLYVVLGEEKDAIHCGIRTAPALADLNHDGILELITGNYSGGLNFYRGIAAPSAQDIKDYFTDLSGFSVYPNPATDQLFLQLDHEYSSLPVSISIHDAQGRCVLKITGQLHQAFSIDIRMLPPGLYVCRTQPNDGSYRELNVKFLVSPK